jgi:hypothetical protein
MGTTRTQYVKLERGERRLSEDWIRRAAEALGVTPGAILERGTVPLVGTVGARGEVVFGVSIGAEVEAPPESSPEMVALQVEHGPLPGIAEDGWLVYYEDRREPVSPELVDCLCVVGLPDGRVLVRKVQKGRTPGLYHLYGAGSDPIFDQALTWAAKVAWIRPR